MPLKKYGVLKGSAVARRLGSGPSPHYQVRLVDKSADYRIAINVSSKLPPSDLEFLVDEHFMHPILEGLSELPLGFTPLPSRPGGLALDFIRGNLFDREGMTKLPPNVPGPDNDLNEKLDHYLQRAMSDEEALVYAFGEPWGPEKAKDKYFGFTPGQGIHDIHMNQGNDRSFADQDGTWQDGGVLIHFASTNQWVGIFLKFQSQTWHTDDRTGRALPAVPTPPAPQPPAPGPRMPMPTPGPTHPDGVVRIVAALVNDTHTPEQETVTLLNTSPESVTLDGWALADRQKHKQPLTGEIAPGATRLVQVEKPLELSNQGGLITLLDDHGLKIHGVAYARAQVRNPGWTLVF
ncbi:DUF2278 family protein [Vitiosangium sp. GDMCC 1.1324]|uniref:DUF2278 family protein n=1 Tax=Vitiosangium sp. (strain GDMCC 1.1324) TaxID=2138576 RepID=UPI000D36CBE6|nr:DUF2278 family protein [Vitiosangium sp. GDMCC 1.1324]PTL78141.1 DUF2278 domain-containing protein [Vitiosangium sp. GDMCC 1.1324]